MLLCFFWLIMASQGHPVWPYPKNGRHDRTHEKAMNLGLLRYEFNFLNSQKDENDKANL